MNRTTPDAVLTFSAITAHPACMQYALRNIPAFLGRILRRLARQRDTSLDEVALEALARGAGATEERVVRRKLRDLAGAWADDPEFEVAIREQCRSRWQKARLSSDAP